MSQTFFPALQYDDAEGAIAWLRDALGFTEVLVVPGDADRPIAHAELALDGAVVMLGSRPPAGPVPPTGVQAIYVAVDDPDALYARATAAGATVLRELTDMEYGSREFTVADPQGHHWSVGTYRPSPGK